MEINPIIKVVGNSCNLNCKYCFYSKQEREKKKMDQETLEKVIYETCKYNSAREIKFFWHGGEPLLAGIEFYEKAFELQEKFKRPNQKISNGVQTNGTLINEKWANCFKDHRIGVGVSLDGPKESHDKYRRFPNGKGTFEKVIQGIEILKEVGVKFSIISVITEENAEIPRELFDFLTSQQATRINFVPAIGISTGSGISFEYSVQPSLYIDFLINVFNLWLNRNDAEIRILPLESIIRAFLGKVQKDCRFAGECEKSLVIDYNGDVLACSTHGYGDFFKFGNIKEGFSSILNSKIYQGYKEYLQGIEKRCSKCRWYQICHGGCPRDHYLGGEQNTFCQDFQRLFSYIQYSLKEYHLI